MDIISELITSTKNEGVCENCNKSFKWSIKDDCYLNLVSKHVEFKCPHCKARYELALMTDLIKEEGEKDE